MYFQFLGTFVWSESHEHANYTNWAPGEPSGPGEDYGDCVFKCLGRCTTSQFGAQQGWHDYNCDGKSWQAPIHGLCETQNI